LSNDTKKVLQHDRDFFNNTKKTNKRKFKIKAKGVIVNISIAFILSVVILFIVNTVLFNEKGIVNSSAQRKNFSVTCPIIADGEFVSFTQDKKHYSYIKDGKLFVKKTSDNSTIDEIQENNPIVHAFTLDDRDIIMYFTYQSPKKLSANTTGINVDFLTADESNPESQSEDVSSFSSSNAASQSEEEPSSKPNSSSVSSSYSSSNSTSASHSTARSTANSSSASSSAVNKNDIDVNNKVGYEISDTGVDSLTIHTYTIDKKEKTKHKSFTVKNFSKIAQVDYSQLTNLIYINTEIKNGTKTSNNIYRVNIVSRVTIFSTGQNIEKIALLSNKDTIFYQNDKNIIFKDSYKYNAIPNEDKGLNLLGKDKENNIYFQSIKTPALIYKCNGNTIIDKIQIENSNFNEVCESPVGLFLIYKDRVLNISAEVPIDIYFSDGTEFYGIFSETLYMNDKEGNISYKNLD